MADAPDLTNLVDLAGARLGGSVVAVNDEFFAFAERMLLPEPPIRRPGVFTERGSWTDGWETRRRRVLPGADWAVVRLGVPGIVHAVTVDTSHFTGNSPEAVEIQGATVGGYPSPEELLDESVQWVTLVARTPVNPDAVNVLPVEGDGRIRITHLRLTIYPDGGVARLRAHGEVVPDPRLLDRVTSDLAAAYLGGVVVAASDMHYGDRHNLNAGGEARVMGEGWETRRRRTAGYDWAVIRLATAGRVVRAEVDTRHFRGNAPRAVALWAAFAPELTHSDDVSTITDWRPMLPPTRTQPNTRHLFDLEVPVEATHVRVDAIPDGGLARLRLLGAPTEHGRESLAVRWLDALSAGAAKEELLACCGSEDWADAVAARRPFGTLEELLAVAEQEWWKLPETAWLEAFTAHPRIGERPILSGAPTTSSRATIAGLDAPRREQAAMESASAEVRAAMSEGNETYEERFGYIFLIRAAGRSAEEILALLRERLGNEPARELRVAAGQQAEITAMRLHRLITGS
ncbi:allantoicase [Frankia sp. AgB1.9]|uniref:allantoicase n=1 Tax=unclassified Frankia TaxID=2632575 RepID=UPI0019314C44|nr:MULTISPECIES: allantoicase [unclassified Frankia]MBL7492470.1 allantoicase [Frankia sp. AgW1.1]MBL7547070.1 allantoicase [Frankia sp. AgB1.9]MBL7619361.1 allantoicase [Frankia sp. AgB1.8]